MLFHPIAAGPIQMGRQLVDKVETMQLAVTQEAPNVVACLRTATADAHRRLEQDLDLLRLPPERERFRRIVGRFRGFHAAWEPAVAAALDEPAFFEPRRRLALIDGDLRALGLGPDEIAALPSCAEAAHLAATPAEAAGSLYVLEGSSLGGQVISRALAGEPWLPPGGLRTFAPYGAETGLMWRGFGVWAGRRAEMLDGMIEGALAAFTLLNRWLPAEDQP